MAKKAKRSAKPKRAGRRGGARAPAGRRKGRGVTKRSSHPPKARNSPIAAPGATDLETQFPNLAADLRWDREQHIRAAMAMGLSRQEAERHADDEMHEDA